MNLIHFLHTRPFAFIHQFLAKLFLGQVDYLVVQSHSAQHDAKTLLLRKKINYVRGPNFHIEPRLDEMVSKSAAKKKLGITGDVLLFFGFVRPYKGLHYLLDAMPAILSKNPNLKLLIVGEYWGDQIKYENQIDLLHIRNNVKIINRFVRDDEVPLFFSAADAVVLPYTAITQSAVIPTALSFGTPILATNISANAEWVHPMKNGLLFSPANSNAIARAVEQFYSEKIERKMRQFIVKNFNDLKWSREVEKKILDVESEFK